MTYYFTLSVEISILSLNGYVLSRRFFYAKIMREHNIPLRYIDQLALFKMRNVTGISLSIHNTSALEIDRLHKQLTTISTIGYYSLKNYSVPYFNRPKNRYEDLSFDKLVAKYYRDKHLKQAVLHAIEDIETTLNTKIASVLGKKYGAYGYLDFRLWCQRNTKNKFLRGKYMNKFVIQREQTNFLETLQYSIKNLIPKMYKIIYVILIEYIHLFGLL